MSAEQVFWNRAREFHENASIVAETGTHQVYHSLWICDCITFCAAVLKKGAADVTIDVCDNIIAPGFMDCQINGAYGIDFSESTLTTDDVAALLDRLPETGVTSICPTLVSSAVTTYQHSFEVLREYMKSVEHDTSAVRCRILGLHLEGPLMAKERKGAHAIHNICAAHEAVNAHKDSSDTANILNAVYGHTDWSAGFVRIVTLAPELPQAMRIIHWLAQHHIVASIGHTDADIATADEAIQSGATMITHLFNAMSGFHHRDPGVPGLIGRRPDIRSRYYRQSSGSLHAMYSQDLKLTTVEEFSNFKAPENAPNGAAKRPAPMASLAPQPFSLWTIGGGALRVHTPTALPGVGTASPTPAVESSRRPSLTPNPATDSSMPSTAKVVLTGTPLPVEGTGPRHLPIDRPFFGLIVDGVHNHPYAVNVAFTSHFKGLVLVTDAMKAMGLPPGRHTLGELSVDIYHGAEDGHYEGLHAVLAGTATLAGAVVPLDRCVRNLKSYTACTIPEALATVTKHPAAVPGLSNILGTLQAGAWADFVILNDELEVQQTYVSGNLAYSAFKADEGR